MKGKIFLFFIFIILAVFFLWNIVDSGEEITQEVTIEEQFVVRAEDGETAEEKVMQEETVDFIATNLFAENECDPDVYLQGIITLHWTPSKRQGLEQRVFFTARADGFERSDYSMSDSLSFDETSFVLEQASVNKFYWMKVLTLQHNSELDPAWHESEVLMVESPICNKFTP